MCGNPKDSLSYSLQYTGDLITPNIEDIRQFVNTFVGSEAIKNSRSSGAVEGVGHRACVDLIDTVDIERQGEIQAVHKVLKQHSSDVLLSQVLGKKRVRELMRMMELLGISTKGITEKSHCVDSLTTYAGTI
jgi:hypothetical protein